MAGISPENEVAREVVDAAFRVHTTLGPGLLESVYEAVLAYELRHRGHVVGCQVPIAVTWSSTWVRRGVPSRPAGR